MTDEISLQITIAERSYKLITSREDEIIFREASRMINERLKSYSSSYAYKDRQDLLAMVALHYTTSALRNEQKLEYRDQGLTEQLQALDAWLESALGNEPENPNIPKG